MGLSAETEEDVLKKHQDLCHNLNMDKDSANEAWQSYVNIRQNYTLEGDQLHWLGCALYVACRKAIAPTVGRSNMLVEGNLVSLTRLLRLCNLSLIQFFSKSKKWADMTNLSPDFRDKINRLERNFAVSMVIFKKFQPIFNDMFVEPTNDQPRQTKSKKQRNLPCTSSRVFDFVWTLFVCVKSEFPEISDDLVNSYHLLLACCDLIYANSIMADRTDLLNNKFPGLPRNYGERNYQPPTDPPCIMSQLCSKHDGILVEAKGIKEYCWKNHMKKLFDRKILRGEPKTLSGLLDVSSFDLNMKAINKVYEEYVLSVGDFDERIFLGDDANTEIGTPTKLVGNTPIGDISEKLQAKRNLNQHMGSISQLAPPTPLTGRKYLKSKEPGVTPVSTATQTVQRLQSLLSGRQAAPSPWLLQTISRVCESDPKIEERVRRLGEKFCAQYTQMTSNHPGTHIDFAQKRLQLAESLFYKLLENILKDEIKKPNFDCNTLLQHEMFHQTLFACCLEIVIYSYNSQQRTFPWVLTALGIEPYHFYKIIEVTVRAEDQLSRDMVKHMNLIEEQILEALAWRGDSPLWEAISASDQPIPSCEDVSLPGTLMEDNSTLTPLNNPAIRRIVLPGLSQSPGPSASERFHSPVTAAIAKKKLFIENTGGVCTVRPGQSLLHAKLKPPVVLGASEDAESKKMSNVIINPAALKEKQNKPNRPRRTGSLGLFFRKFYHVASVRMQELCNHLELRETELRRKIWTCFEHSIRDHTDLMLDRHLDQILMCAVYVMCKIEGLDKPFTEVMKCYRLQPQSASHVYRSVLLGSRDQAANNYTGKLTQETEDRCDIIKFYNSVYVLKMQNFVRKFAGGNAQNGSLTLSPLPVTRSVPMSPRRRVSDMHSVFIRPLTSSEPNAFPPSPTRPLSYCFSRSPAKDLKAINSMMREIDPQAMRRVGKRLLNDDNAEEDGLSPPKQPKFVASKIQDLVVDRLIAKSQDS
uniref:Retinoblastoma-like protein 1 n=2 Tax=Graphocephala atropunctata TaxID=36148 RepID=A0A1B6KSV5_9HEMI